MAKQLFCNTCHQENEEVYSLKISYFANVNKLMGFTACVIVSDISNQMIRLLNLLNSTHSTWLILGTDSLVYPAF